MNPGSQSEHGSTPPVENVPPGQAPHSVSVAGVQTFIRNFPGAQVAQVEQPAAPLPLDFPSSHSEHSSVPPTEYVPAAHCSSPWRSDVGLYPAFAVLQAYAPSMSLYCPSPSHCLHVMPSSEYVGGEHGAQEEDLPVEVDPNSQAVQPTAPLTASFSLYLPAGQAVQLVLPPIEYVPAGQATIPVRSVSEVGLKPAGADLQEDAPSISLNFPSPLHCLQMRPSSE